MLDGTLYKKEKSPMTVPSGTSMRIDFFLITTKKNRYASA
jgi:hypothetical protein